MKSILIGGLLFCTMTGGAQQSKVGNWIVYTGDHKFAKRWMWHGQVNWRNYNFAGNTEQLLLRTGFGYNLRENNHQLMLGYAFAFSQPYIKGTNEKGQTKEHRIFQHYIYKHASGKVNFLHRFRPEQRWVDGKFSFRMRYMVSIAVPLYGRKIESQTLYFTAFNELFISSVKARVFDRNRTFAGLGFMFSEYLRLEMGLMYQVQKGLVRPQGWISFVNTMPFTKRM